MKKTIVYLNGKYLSADKAVIHADDRGFLMGDGVYDTILAEDGVAVFLEDHLERLARSLAKTSIAVRDDFAKIVRRLLRENPFDPARIRITVSRGRHLGPVGMYHSTKATRLVVVSPDRLPAPDAAYTLHTYSSGGAAIPGVKGTSLAGNIMARTVADRHGADETLLLTYDGIVLEGGTSNIFWLAKNTLCTPSLDLPILPGITRKYILAAARKTGLKIAEGRYRLQDIAASDGVFVTSSVRGMVRVGKIDRYKIPVHSEKLAGVAHAYRALVEKYIRRAKSASSARR